MFHFALLSAAGTLPHVTCWALAIVQRPWHEHPLVFALMLAAGLTVLTCIKNQLERRRITWSRGIECE